MPVATTPTPDSRLVARDLLQLIGNTPLIRLERIVRDYPGIEIFGKAEFFNPGGSVKDRAGLNMIRECERVCQLTPDKIILDATSGNTGIALAFVAAVKGYRIILTMPETMSVERRIHLLAFGAEIVLTTEAQRTRRGSP